MLDNNLLLKVLKKTLSSGGDYADIFVEHKKVVLIHLEDNRIEKVITGVDSGAGIRLIYNGKSAYAYSNDLSEKSLLTAASEVYKAASGTITNAVVDLKNKTSPVSFTIKLFPNDIPIDRKISLVRKANTVARGFDHRIQQASATYNDFIQKVQIATSDGTITEDERVHTLTSIHVIASDGSIIQTGYEFSGGLIGFELFDDIDIEELSLKATKRAVMMLSARRAPGGRMPVVISYEAGGTMIHEAVGHGLEADLAQQGLSIYSQKIGQNIASPLITVIDDSTIARKRGSFRFDDEGIPSQQTVLVENGILKSYMYDRLTARKDGVISTGNGRRQSYQHRPLPRMTNTYIVPGTMSPEKIINSVEYGLFVKKMGGGQVNTVTGDFVFEVQEGYLISKGNIGEPVRGATLAGNGPDVLKSIDMVGFDLGFAIGTCGKDAQGVPVSDGMPTIRIPEIVIGGAAV
ncbi:MAG: TldD/PmbA family protein [Nitrospirota bacterium]|nr:TldD/PmbA family protein [Nitrospirota bacterium]MDH5768062.1 TldD/PmbA family protein [Nitrospirota bacterium]